MDEKETLERSLKNVNEAIEDLSKELLTGMDAAGVESIRYPFGILTKSEILSVKQEDPEAAITWLKRRRLGMIVKQTVNARTLTSTMKEMLQQGKPFPSVEESGMVLFTKQLARVKRRPT